MKLPETDRHHVFYERASYLRGTPQYLLRTQHLLIPRISYDTHHHHLHPNIEPPEMPTEDMAIFAIGYLATLGNVDHLEAIESLASILDRRSMLGGQIAENMMRQLVYIESGYVRT